MTAVKRLCPVCGAANAMDRARCHACGADIQPQLPAPSESNLPVPWKQVRTSLAVSAGVLALRAGLHLARHLLERKMRPDELREPTATPIRVRGRSPRRGQGQAPLRPQPRLRVWGRRAWRSWSSDGAGQKQVEEFYYEADAS
jgi:hypothetical protein